MPGQQKVVVAAPNRPRAPGSNEEEYVEEVMLPLGGTNEKEYRCKVCGKVSKFKTGETSRAHESCESPTMFELW